MQHGTPIVARPKAVALAATWLGCLTLALPALASAQLPGAAPLPGDAALASLAGQQLEPDVAPGAGSYLAVWTDERTSLERTVDVDPWGVVQTDVYAARFLPDGTLLDPSPIAVDTSPFSQEKPRVAGNGQDWLVVYESRSVSSTQMFTSRDVRAVRVSSGGVVLDPSPLVIDTGDSDVYVPVVAGDGSGWAVFWTNASTIYGRRIDATGNVGPMVVVHTGTQWIFDPAVAFAQDRYLVTWERTSGTFGRFVDADLQPIGSAVTISGLGIDPAVATDGTDFFVTFADLGSWPTLRGTVVRRDGTIVAPGGTVLDNSSFLALEPATVAWDGLRYLVAWNEGRWVGSGTREELLLNLLDADGNIVTPAPISVIASTDFSVGSMVATSDGLGSTFLGWMDSRNGVTLQLDGFATVVGSDGSFDREIPFMQSAPAQIEPDLVPGPAGATAFEDVNLAVFVSADAVERRIVFQRLDGAGNALDAEPRILAGGTDTYRSPAAAWNGQLWLVVWEDTRGGPAHNGGVLAARVLPDGSVIDAVPFQVLAGNDPDVGAVGGDFLVAASELTSGDVRTLYGMRVGPDGTLLDASKLFLGFDYALAPSVEGFADRWLVAWHRHPTHDTPSSSLQARFVLAGGAVQPLLDPTTSTAYETFADIAIDGGVATLAWSDGDDVRVRQILADGTLLGPAAGVVVSTGAVEASAPTIAWDGARFAVAWVDDRIHHVLEPGVGDLLGTRLDAGLGVLDPGGAVLAADPKAPEGEAALCGRSGVTLVLYPALIEASGTWRMHVGAWVQEMPSSRGNVSPAGSPRAFGRGVVLQQH